MSNLIVFLQSLPCMFMGLNVMGIVFKLVKNYKDKGVVWVKKNAHSSLITEISSLITYHWKFPNFLRWHVWHLLPTFDNSKTLTFCETNCLSGSRLAYSRIHSRQTNFTSFFPLAHVFSQNTWWTQPRKSIRTPPTPSSSHLPQKPKPNFTKTQFVTPLYWKF